MKLHTVATFSDHQIETYHHQYLKLVDYTEQQCQELMQQAKHYYVKLYGESESTDFNDRYSDCWTRFYPITLQNVLVEDGKFAGVVVYGTEKYDDCHIVCTLQEPKAHWYDGSDYSSISRDYFLMKYDLPICALDFAQTYHVALESKEYKRRNGTKADKLENTYNYVYPLMAWDVIVQDGIAVGAKHNDHTYLIGDASTLSYQIVENDKYVSSRYLVKTFTLAKTN